MCIYIYIYIIFYNKKGLVTLRLVTFTLILIYIDLKKSDTSFNATKRDSVTL